MGTHDNGVLHKSIHAHVADFEWLAETTHCIYLAMQPADTNRAMHHASRCFARVIKGVARRLSLLKNLF